MTTQSGISREINTVFVIGSRRARGSAFILVKYHRKMGKMNFNYLYSLREDICEKKSFIKACERQSRKINVVLMNAPVYVSLTLIYRL